jgi:protein-L-isoaspartate(D-aspartate) O-methyltransferase
MIMPLGVATQQLTLIEKQGETFVETRLEAVRFVPLLTGVE